MRTTITVILTAMALGSGLGALAQTPDGQTPAEETICSPLQDDGVTKGLYGLCVAFCEAQDITDEEEPITAAELETLEMSSPSGRILANYNKKKDKAANAADPDMPCILVEEPCPCWSAEELAAVGDGYTTTGNPDTAISCFNSNGGPNERIFVNESSTTGDFENEFIDVVDWDTADGENEDINRCYYQNVGNTGTNIVRNLSIEQGTLTEAQLSSCKESLTPHHDDVALCP